ncbi:DUF4231 domain-containing protein [Streptomyces sp. NPDC050743]|uniref:DUF4231 domain-containing protein n=1 Tax=Streptomyces sp. NPDC050743 TaxID=3365634 RepID=UPI0037A68E02
MRVEGGRRRAPATGHARRKLVLAFTGFLRGCPGLRAGEESDSCEAGQGQPDRRQGDPASTPHGGDAAHDDRELSTVTATVLSLIVVGSVSLESVYRYREQWKNYRSTEQLLGHERIYFETKVGPYAGLSESEAFTTLVARVESAIANENSATLNVMTLGGQVSTDVQTPLSIPGARREPQ